MGWGGCTVVEGGVEVGVEEGVDEPENGLALADADVVEEGDHAGHEGC